MNYPEWIGTKLTTEEQRRQSIQDSNLIFLHQVKRFNKKVINNKRMTTDKEKDNE